jgi:ParB-like chromosome segregation protein Spo0J
LSLPEIVSRKVADLIPYARNARTHSDAQVAQIAASIREFGWTNPVLVDGENGIIAGHGRVLAARKLGKSVLVLCSQGRNRSGVVAAEVLIREGHPADEVVQKIKERRRDALTNRTFVAWLLRAR